MTQTNGNYNFFLSFPFLHLLLVCLWDLSVIFIHIYYQWNNNSNENLNYFHSYKLPYKNCNKFYVRWTNINFITRINQHRIDFIYAEEKSKFAELIIDKGHEMRHIEGTMTFINTESKHTINILEEIETMRAAKSHIFSRKCTLCILWPYCGQCCLRRRPLHCADHTSGEPLKLCPCFYL